MAERPRAGRNGFAFFAVTETRVGETVYKGALENIAPLGKLGVVALATDLTIERDLRRMLPEGVGIFTNRVLNANPMTLANLRAMEGDLARAAAGILPGAKTDAVIYGCTSGSAAIGLEKTRRLIRQSHPRAAVITPLTAAAAAIKRAGAKRVSFLTPYIKEINCEMARAFADLEIAPVNILGMGMESDIDAAGIPPAEIARSARAAVDSSADALFISCTALRASEVLSELESELNIPVFCSNQTLAWAALRELKCDAKIQNRGRLLEREWG